MLLKTTVIREGGSTHEIDGIRYHFAPRVTDGPHVCEVATSAHLKRFLQIEGFEIADDAEGPVSVPQAAPLVLDPAGFLGTKHPLDPGHTHDPKVLVSPAYTPPAQEEGAVAWVPPAPAPENTGDDADAEPKPYESMSLEELRDAFFAKFGKAPHPKAKTPKIIEYLRNPPVLADKTGG